MAWWYWPPGHHSTLEFEVLKPVPSPHGIDTGFDLSILERLRVISFSSPSLAMSFGTKYLYLSSSSLLIGALGIDSLDTVFVPRAGSDHVLDMLAAGLKPLPALIDIVA